MDIQGTPQPATPQVAAAFAAMAIGRALGVGSGRERGRDGIEPREGHPRSAFVRDTALGPEAEWVSDDVNPDASALDPAATAHDEERDEITWRGSAPHDPLAARLDEMTPGAEMLELLAGLDLSETSQPTLLSTIAAYERLRRVAEAGMMAAIAEADRRCFLGDVSLSSLAAELSTRMSISSVAAERRVGEAFDLVQAHPILWNAMALGRIDKLKAMIIAECVEPAAPHVSQERFDRLQRRLVDLAERTTPTKLRNHAKASVDALVPAVQPEEAHEEAREKRHVWFWDLPDGMASVGAELPAADAMAVKTVLDRMAAAKAKDDPRNVNQRRADAFSGIFRAMLDADETPLGSLPGAQRSRPHILLNVRALPGRDEMQAGDSLGEAAGSLLGDQVNTHQITLAGYGPVTLSAAEKAVGMGARNAGFATATISLVIADPWSGENRAVIAAPRGLDSAHVFEALREGRNPLEYFAKKGNDPPGREASGVPPGPSKPSKRQPGTQRPGNDELGDRETGPQRLNSEKVLDAPPAGPISQEPAVSTTPSIDRKAIRLAAEFVAASNSYRPSAELIRRVLIRDSTCLFPTCAVPAWRCQIDHIEPFDPARPAEDQTREDNLQTVCGSHHELKTSQGWTVKRDPATGIVTWRSPYGATFTSRATYLEPLA